ncbi:phospholipid/glycerol acyltransferase [Yersinia nurmii]|uniref:Phospholipid/glycerol acyltransferase n=1 Tax=Yersinia nurmii TaxID=685706 RepID=A0ABM9S5I4_9GAMM|nr:lysophospholipid acyltransferase family protein [Yersinia nurmii]CNE23047.1 phospholipid/glycerol acyltransferase [Yersinia nurmii]
MIKFPFILSSKMVATILVSLCRLLTGIRSRWLAPLPDKQVRIYYANHSSHLDGLVIWASMPRHLRSQVHPVAAADYWSKTRLRRYLAKYVFHAVLVERRTVEGRAEARKNPLTPLLETLERNQSLILFPEGTRGDGENIQSFKSGVYHLARQYPDVELVPVWLENLNRVLPKGSKLVVPFICSATFGVPVTGLQEGEDKAAFLARIKAALEEMAP